MFKLGDQELSVGTMLRCIHWEGQFAMKGGGREKVIQRGADGKSLHGISSDIIEVPQGVWVAVFSNEADTKFIFHHKNKMTVEGLEKKFPSYKLVSYTFIKDGTFDD